MMTESPIDRRTFTRLALGAGAAAATSACSPPAADVVAQATGRDLYPTSTPLPSSEPALDRRISAFQVRDWQNHFSSLRNGAILVDTGSRALHFWSDGGGDYRVYPVSVALTPELTRRGRTRVVQKRVGPDWRPTPNMLRRQPDLPAYVPPGPENPLGTHALYLSWQYYRIHGTNDTRKIGRRSSNGCVGLYNEHIAELFGMTVVGTQVLIV